MVVSLGLSCIRFLAHLFFILLLTLKLQKEVQQILTQNIPYIFKTKFEMFLVMMLKISFLNSLFHNAREQNMKSTQFGEKIP